MRKKITIADVIIGIILIFCAFSCLMPILNTIAISFSDRTSAALGKVYYWPVNFTIAAYEAMIHESQFIISFLNSIYRVLIGVSINMLLSILMAYPLAKDTKTFKYKKVYMWIIIVTMMFNGGLVPTFLVIKNLGLMDTIWALVLPTAVPVFNVILLMNFFKGVPNSLEEAAEVDGANPMQILWKIFVPISKPALATIGLFAIVAHWNAFFDGKIYINSPAKLPLQTYIQSLTVDLNPERMANMTPDQIERQMAMSSLTFNSAKVIVSMVPILLIYPFIQKYFVTGIVVGAVKE